MPDLPARPGDFHSLFQAVFRLYQNPASWEATAAIEKGIQGYAAISLINHVGFGNFPFTEEDFALVAAGQPDRVPLAAKMRETHYGLVTAGHVLVYTLRLAKHMPRLASAATAMRILEQLYMTSEYRWPASPTSIKTAWRKYRPVAPFFAAASFMPDEYTSLMHIFPTAIDSLNEDAAYIKTDPAFAAKVMADKDGVAARLDQAERLTLPRYFAYAEALRRAGEAHFATGQDVHGNSLLDPELSWRVPEGFTLPKVTLDLDPLSDEELRAAGVK